MGPKMWPVEVVNHTHALQQVLLKGEQAPPGPRSTATETLESPRQSLGLRKQFRAGYCASLNIWLRHLLFVNKLFYLLGSMAFLIKKMIIVTKRGCVDEVSL